MSIRYNKIVGEWEVVFAGRVVFTAATEAAARAYLASVEV